MKPINLMSWHPVPCLVHTPPALHFQFELLLTYHRSSEMGGVRFLTDIQIPGKLISTKNRMLCVED